MKKLITVIMWLWAAAHVVMILYWQAWEMWWVAVLVLGIALAFQILLKRELKTRTKLVLLFAIVLVNILLIAVTDHPYKQVGDPGYFEEEKRK